MFSLPDLPYAYGALEPVISERTLRLHHDKHHGAYVKALNALLEPGKHSDQALEDIILEASRSEHRKLFNNAAQAWNHSFFWMAMSAGRELPSGTLAVAIDTTFGGLAGLKTTFVDKGAAHFGSGWVWLAADQIGALRVLATHDANDTLSHAGLTPLLVCDLWEHAYYLDHQNDRKGYLDAWFDVLPNWEFASAQYAAAEGRSAPWRHPAPTPASVQHKAA